MNYFNLAATTKNYMRIISNNSDAVLLEKKQLILTNSRYTNKLRIHNIFKKTKG